MPDLDRSAGASGALGLSGIVFRLRRHGPKEEVLGVVAMPLLADVLIVPLVAHVPPVGQFPPL